MMALCSSDHSKIPSLIFNSLFCLLGVLLILMGLGVLMETTKCHVLNLVMAEEETRFLILIISYTLIIIGAGMIGLVSMGCCYTIQNRPSFITVYLTLLVALQFVELTALLVTVMCKDAMLTDLKPRLFNSLNSVYGHQHSDNYNRHGDNVFTKDIDYTQYTFKCCGVTGPEDYSLSRWFNESQTSREPRNVPITCCARLDYEEGSAGSPLSVVSRVFHGTVEEKWQNPRVQREIDCQSNKTGARYTQGCLQPVHDWFATQSLIFILSLLVPLLSKLCCTFYYLKVAVKLRSLKRDSTPQVSSQSSTGG